MKQKEQIEQLKQKKIALLLQLGEQAHQKIIHNQFDLAEIVPHSASVLALDKEIYQTSMQLIGDDQVQNSCTKCHQTMNRAAKFCGACGNPNELYVEVNISKKTCSICEEHIPSTSNYCPCCGSKQGGI